MFRRSVVVPAVVVFALLGGGAAAATGYIITNINQIKPSVRAQLRGMQGPRGFTGPRGLQGQTGAQGQQGAAGSALAHAHVSAAGGVDLVKVVTSANVTHPQPGIYCITGLPFTPNNAVATIGTNGPAVNDAVELGSTSGCPGGTQLFVETYTITMNTGTGQVSGFTDVDTDFYIAIN